MPTPPTLEGTTYGNQETFETLDISITVISPNGGENWQVGSSQDITWTSTGNVNNVMIEYSTDRGTSWATIAASIANNGSYNLTVPNTPSENCLVRITGIDIDGDPSDVSNAVFSITLN